MRTERPYLLLPVKRGDGLLTLGEILALKLDADWVVLSACNTASADGETSEAMSGLARAFFYAGARALLVSNWPVETVSAKKLTTDIFRRQADQPGLSRAQALRRSMVQLINGPGFTIRAERHSSHTHIQYSGRHSHSSVTEEQQLVNPG